MIKNLFTVTLLGSALALTACSGTSNSSKQNKTNPTPQVEKPQPVNEPKPAVEPTPATKQVKQAQIETSMGSITVELNNEKAPNTVKNFVAYANSRHYNGTIFHRVIDNFMIQGGGFDVSMTKKPVLAPIKNEANNGLKNTAGTIAMARTSDPHSATAQFFINVKDNAFLDHTAQTNRGWGYTVFGKVTQGMDVVNKIKAVQTGNKSGMNDVPLQPVVILSVSIQE